MFPQTVTKGKKRAAPTEANTTNSTTTRKRAKKEQQSDVKDEANKENEEIAEDKDLRPKVGDWSLNSVNMES